MIHARVGLRFSNNTLNNIITGKCIQHPLFFKVKTTASHGGKKIYSGGYNPKMFKNWLNSWFHYHYHITTVSQNNLCFYGLFKPL